MLTIYYKCCLPISTLYYNFSKPRGTPDITSFYDNCQVKNIIRLITLCYPCDNIVNPELMSISSKLFCNDYPVKKKQALATLFCSCLHIF